METNTNITEIKNSIEGLLKTQYQAQNERLELLEKSTSKRFDALDQLKLDKVAEAQAETIKGLLDLKKELAIAAFNGFTEEDTPNFFSSSYSVVKGYTDKLICKRIKKLRRKLKLKE
jgi:hypothetical protein